MKVVKGWRVESVERWKLLTFFRRDGCRGREESETSNKSCVFSGSRRPIGERSCFGLHERRRRQQLIRMIKYTQFLNESSEQLSARNNPTIMNQEQPEGITVEKSHQLNDSAFNTSNEKVTRNMLLKRFVEHLAFRCVGYKS